LKKLKRLSIFGRYSKKIIEDAAKRLKGGDRWETTIPLFKGF
jgi:hypothetical protein